MNKNSIRDCRIGKESDRDGEPGVLGSEAGTDSVQWICVPHLGIPSLEPASESWRLCSLFDGGDGDSFATGGIRVHIFFCCTTRRKRGEGTGGEMEDENVKRGGVYL